MTEQNPQDASQTAPVAAAAAVPSSDLPIAPIPSAAPEAEIQEQPVDAPEVKPMELTIEMPTEAYFISGIRDFVLNLTKNMTGFSEQWAFRFQAVVDELCNNAIEHGSAPGQKIRVTMVSVQGKSLDVMVEDTGTAQEKKTPEEMLDLYRERRNMTPDQFLGFRGRGLPMIIGEWTDEVLFEESSLGGIKVHIKKYLRKDEDEVLSAQANDPSHLVLT